MLADQIPIILFDAQYANETLQSRNHITYPSKVLVASNARPSKTSTFNKNYARKSNFGISKIMRCVTVETAVRKGFRLGQKMSFCSLNSSFTRVSIMYKYNGLELYRIKLSF